MIAGQTAGYTPVNETPTAESVEPYMTISFRLFKVPVRNLCLFTAFVHLCLVVLYEYLYLTDYNPSSQHEHMKQPITKSFGAWVHKPIALFNASDPNGTSTSVADCAPFDFGTVLKDQDTCRQVEPRDSRSDNYFIQPIALAYTQFDSRAAIILFHLLSFLFETINAVDKNEYHSTLLNGRTHLGHFLEYSFSASLMIVTMSVQLGITDLYTLLGVFSNGWACMIFGLLAEIMFENDVKPVYIFHRPVAMHWATHFAGWVTLAFALVSLCSNLDTFRSCFKGVEVPWFVWGIVVGEIILFTCFGLVQIISFCRRPPFSDTSRASHVTRVQWAVRTEGFYVVLSLTAKTLLGALIFWGS